MTGKVAIIGCVTLVASIAVSAQTKKTDDVNRLDARQTLLIDSMDGDALYRAWCATCHGADGKGVGPMTKWLTITSPDLTRISARNGGKFPLVRVQKIIAGEGDATRGHGTREMPVWGPIFSQVGRDQDLRLMRVYSLAKYLESIQQR